MKIGLIKEGKTPPDKRVVLSPIQCKYIVDNYPNIKLFIQKSNIRKFTDIEYSDLGLNVVDNVNNCDILIGVKEVPINELIPNKKYFFFSHTYKQQEYNKDLLIAILNKNIQLIDWEVITDIKGRRLIAFGRYAGIVGCYNGLLGFGLKHNLFSLKRAKDCRDRKDMEAQLSNVKLPNNFKLVITGRGRVAGGAIEILDKLDITKVSPEEFLTKDFSQPVYAQLGVEHYNRTNNNTEFIKKEFFNDPSDFKSNFLNYAKVADMYVACHYWDSRAPYIFTKQDARNDQWNISMIADISCDIDCAVASTLRPSTIADPFYAYNRKLAKEDDFYNNDSIGVMAVDNLPCELPLDASVDFGEMFIKHVLDPITGNDPDNIIWRASQTKDSKLTPHFEYLKDYINT